MWKATLAGDLATIASKLLARAPQAVPDELMLGAKAFKNIPAASWQSLLTTSPDAWSCRWKSSGWAVALDENVVTVQTPAIPSVGTATELLSDLPFEVAAFASLHPWVEDGAPYLAPTFAGGHVRHGWACAFRGAGHARLVSRRWLDRGPWLVEYGADDLSFVLFHDPTADAATALAEAAPGHRAMGISDEGGYIQSPYVYKNELKGQYLPAIREMRIIASRRDVSQREMRDACAARLERRWDVPVDRVAFVFLEEDRARRHVELLWLHDLGCLTIIDGNEVRLDAELVPPPYVLPAWTSRVRS